MQNVSKDKVLILGKIPPPYMGPAVATQIILNSKLKNEFDLIHFDTRLNPHLSGIGKWGVKKFFKSLSLYISLAKRIRQNKPRLVLIPVSQSTLGFLKDSLYILIARFHRTKIVIHLRGSNFRNWLLGTPYPVRVYSEWIIRRCQGAIVLGKRMVDIFRPYFDPENIFVVPNGADYILPSRTRPTTDNKTIILYLSNLQPSKGIEDVIEAVRLLKDKSQKNFLLQVFGEWRDAKFQEKNMNEIKNHNLPVHFYSQESGDDKYTHLVNADIFVFPPREPEGHPWVTVEAMAAGLPIVSTDQGAIPESVIDGTNGFVVESNSPQYIADRITLLMEQPGLRERMGKESRTLYEKNFTEDKMADNLSIVFKSLIHGQ